MELESAALYLPQKAPFLLVDNIIYCEGDKCGTNYKVTESHRLYESGHLSEAGLIENMAQTCAARIGYICVHSKNEKVRIGVIGNIKCLEIFRLPAADEIIETEVKEILNFLDVTAFSITVKVKGENIASGEMKVALLNEEAML